MYKCQGIAQKMNVRTDFGAVYVQLWIHSAEPPGEHC